MLEGIHFAWVVVLALGTTGVGPKVVAQQPQDELNRWLGGVWEAARDKRLDVCLRMELRLVHLFVPPAAELEKLRHDVKIHPQHEGLPRLKEYDRVLAGKPYTVRTRVWACGGDWRSSTDHTNGQMGEYWMDDCVAGERMWCLRQDSLVRVDTRREHPDFYDYRKHTPGVASQVWSFATGGLTLVNVNDMPTPRASLRGESWEAVSTTPGGAKWPRVVRLAGTWDAEARTGTITAVRWRVIGSLDEGTDLFSDSWREASPFKGLVAGRIREVTPAGRPDREFILIECEAVEKSEARRIMETPRAGGVDPVRGATTFHAIHDFTGSEGVIVRTGVDGRTLTAPFDQGKTHAQTSLRRAGWWTAGALLCSLVLLKARRLVKEKQCGVEGSR
ncbi:MAG: hypothetical protein ACK4WH_13310 [Phycisphaerales bacterium]